MPIDLLEKLAEVPVPPAPPPKVFDRAIHERINSRLIVGQIFDLLIRGSAYAVLHFAKAVVGMVRLTLTGKLESPKNGRNR